MVYKISWLLWRTCLWFLKLLVTWYIYHIQMGCFTLFSLDLVLCPLTFFWNSIKLPKMTHFCRKFKPLACTIANYLWAFYDLLCWQRDPTKKLHFLTFKKNRGPTFQKSYLCFFATVLVVQNKICMKLTPNCLSWIDTIIII